MNNIQLYPLKFKPILKSLIWGGSKICKYKEIECDKTDIGESWELSTVKDNVSIVENGALAGYSLTELISAFGERLIGKNVYPKFKEGFPLLIKFIDSNRDLSIQVHPNDKLAKERHNSLGKTEMWYVIDTEPGAFVYSGFKKKITPDEYEKRVKEDTIQEVLFKHDVKPGDVLFLPAGRVHAIGAGCLIAEIQQSSDITYRIYDYNRKGKDGKPRELHTELAKEAIDYNLYNDYIVHYNTKPNQSVNIVSCKYFNTNILKIDRVFAKYIVNNETFYIYICVKGECSITDEQNNNVLLLEGETLLIPAATKSILISPIKDSTLLEVSIQ